MQAIAATARSQGVDARGWIACCPRHGTYVECRSKADAKDTHTIDFCEECREEGITCDVCKED